MSSAIVLKPVRGNLRHNFGELLAVLPRDVAIFFAMPEMDERCDGADFKTPLEEIDVSICDDHARPPAQCLHDAAAQDTEDVWIREHSTIFTAEHVHKPL